jgi:hypothetical protein
MRWLADGEVVWSWHLDADVKPAEVNCRRRWQESPITGESTKEGVKTIARGMPGEPGVTVVTTLVCFLFFAREAAGAPSARHSLRPPISGDRNSNQDSRRSCGELAKLWLFEI